MTSWAYSTYTLDFLHKFFIWWHWINKIMHHFIPSTFFTFFFFYLILKYEYFWYKKKQKKSMLITFFCCSETKNVLMANIKVGPNFLNIQFLAHNLLKKIHLNTCNYNYTTTEYFTPIWLGLNCMRQDNITARHFMTWQNNAEETYQSLHTGKANKYISFLLRYQFE